MPNPIDDARQLISSRLADIDGERERLERALASLGEESGRRRRPGRPAKRVSAEAPPSKKPARLSRKPRGSKRAKRGQRQEELLVAIKKMRGASPAELADAMGIGSNHVYGLIRKAEVDGRIKKKGQGYRLGAAARG